MGVKTTFTLGTFVENISGTVVNPDNALGAPNTVFTGNTSGSWTAKWALQTPSNDDVATLTPLVHQNLRIHCRRASGAGAQDPIIRKVIVRDHLDRPVYEYVAGLQLNQWLGPVGPSGNWIEMPLRTLLWNAASIPRPTSLGISRIGAIAFSKLDPVGTVYAMVENVGLIKITGVNTATPQVARVASSASGWPTGASGRREFVLSPDETLIGFREGPAIAYEVEVSGNPRYALFPALSSVDDIAFSPDSNYVLAVSASQGYQFARLYSVDRVGGTLTDVSPAFMTTATYLGSSTTRKSCAWQGNLAVVSNQSGFSAYEWDPTTETFSEIAEAQSFQFSPPEYSTAISLSPDSRFVAIHCRSSKELRVFDMQDLAAGWRSVVLHSLLGSIGSITNRPFWHPDGTAVFVSLSDNANSNAYGQVGTTIGVHVPYVTGALTIESPAPANNTVPSFPLAASPLGALDFGTNKVVLAGPDLVNSSETHDNVVILDRVSPTRDKDIVVLNDIWGPALVSGRRLPFNYAHVGEWNSVRLSVVASSTQLGSTEDHYQPFSPCGRYLGYGYSGEFNIAKIDNYLADLPLSSVRVPPPRFFNTFTTAAAALSWSYDGRYAISGAYLGEVDYATETVTPITLPAEFSQAGIPKKAVFRPCASGDAHPYVIMLVTTSALDPDQYHRMYEIVNGVVVRNSSLDLPSPPHNFNGGEDLFTVSFSKDGNYLAVLTRFGPYTLWRWNNGSPDLAFTGATNPGSNSQGRISWHPSDTNVVLISDLVYNFTYPDGIFRLHRIHASSVDSFQDTNARDYFNSTAGPNSIAYSAVFTPDGHYLALSSLTVPASGAGNTTGGLRDTDASGFTFYQWDINRYNTGLRHVPNCQNKTFLCTRPISASVTGPGTLVESHDGRLVRYLPGHVREDLHNSTYVLQGMHKDIDPSSIVYDAGWTIEIAVEGDGTNTVQLEAVELELEMDKYLLPAPTNLQVISATGASALVEWDWEPAP